MGSATRNFYNDAFARQGFEDDVREVQRLWLAGEREAAGERVPIEIGLGTNLVGTDELVRDRLRRYRDVGITTLRANLETGTEQTTLAARLDQLGRLLGLVREVNDEPAGEAGQT